MSRLLEALGVTAGAVVLTVLVILIGSINLFGPLALYMLMFIASVASFVFSFWLKRRGELIGQPTHVEYAKYLRRSAYLMLILVVIRYKVPNLAPETFGYIKSIFASMEQSAHSATLEQERPHAVPCDGALIGGKGETKYWYHPEEDPLLCYNHAGRHPDGKGELLAVDDTIARIIDRQRLRTVAKAEPPPTPPPPAPPPTEPQTQTVASRGDWLAIPQ